MKTPSNNTIALVLGTLSFVLSITVFFMSRNDPGLRMAALVAATSTGAGLLAICSTLLTGKDVTTKDLPPGSTQVTQVSPTNTTVTVDPTSQQETK